jgi:hypothetical protein
MQNKNLYILKLLLIGLENKKLELGKFLADGISKNWIITRTLIDDIGSTENLQFYHLPLINLKLV